MVSNLWMQNLNANSLVLKYNVNLSEIGETWEIWRNQLSAILQWITVLSDKL
jgi:hypothetical protein